MAYETERATAVETVLRACRLCEAVRAELVTEETVAKKDKSPVTVADFSVQAQVNLDLARAFPDDPVVAEEDTSTLRAESGAALRAKILRYVAAEVPGVSEEQVLSAIERGDFAGGATGRFWTLDPIDGTKGFLRGEQYAIALALIEEGEVVLSALGCPNLPQNLAAPQGARGGLFLAVKGQGAWMRALDSPTEHSIHVTHIASTAQAAFCESVEAAHSSHDDAARIAVLLGVTAPPIRMDSQCKYAAVARGDASIYLRLPTSADYEEKIWDHAAGYLLTREAGGEITDIHGSPLDFGQGRTLRRNTGIVATNGLLHPLVLAAVRNALSSRV